MCVESYPSACVRIISMPCMCCMLVQKQHQTANLRFKKCIMKVVIENIILIFILIEISVCTVVIFIKLHSSGTWEDLISLGNPDLTMRHSLKINIKELKNRLNEYDIWHPLFLGFKMSHSEKWFWFAALYKLKCHYVTKYHGGRGLQITEESICILDKTS